MATSTKNQEWLFWVLVVIFVLWLFFGLRKKALSQPVKPVQPQKGQQSSGGGISIGGGGGSTPSPTVSPVPPPASPVDQPTASAQDVIPCDPSDPVQCVPNPGDNGPPVPVTWPGQETGTTVVFTDPTTGAVIDTSCDPANPDCNLLPLDAVNTADPSAVLDAIPYYGDAQQGSLDTGTTDYSGLL